jgi:F-type H+-transporting ATPase subunit b
MTIALRSVAAAGVLLAVSSPAWAGEETPSVTESGSIYNALWAVGLFVVLLAILTKAAWGPVVRALQQREQYVQSTLAAAEAKDAESQRLLAEYQARLAAVDKQAAEEMDRARKAADAAREQILAAAREEATAISHRAARDIDNARQTALEELRTLAVELSTAVAEKIIRKRLDPADQQRLVEESLDMIRAMPKKA